MSSQQQQQQQPPPPAYDFQRSDEDADHPAASTQPLHQHHYPYSDAGDESEGYLDIHTASGDHHTVGTAANIQWNTESNTSHPDATAAVAEMHLALLYLLSNPQEFERAKEYSTGANNDNLLHSPTTLQQWNSEYYYNTGDDQSLYTEADDSVAPAVLQAQSSPNNSNNTVPLPFCVFCDDAEVVLPQAHTASQLFGLETVTGMELEAAAGVPAVSQLFLRWLALLPGGDHLNLIDPPGLTVMRIAGGRYRVTAAHRVVWTWQNELAAVSSDNTSLNSLQPGDLVKMTIVDVFETDNRGKLLSYCPTFDNRAVTKQDRTAHALRKKSVQLAAVAQQHSKLYHAVAKHAAQFAAKLYHAVDDAVHQYKTEKKEEHAHHDDNITIPARPPRKDSMVQQQQPVAGTSAYHADDDMERHEV